VLTSVVGVLTYTSDDASMETITVIISINLLLKTWNSFFEMLIRKWQIECFNDNIILVEFTITHCYSYSLL